MSFLSPTVLSYTLKCSVSLPAHKDSFPHTLAVPWPQSLNWYQHEDVSLFERCIPRILVCCCFVTVKAQGCTRGRWRSLYKWELAINSWTLTSHVRDLIRLMSCRRLSSLLWFLHFYICSAQASPKEVVQLAILEYCSNSWSASQTFCL